MVEKFLPEGTLPPDHPHPVHVCLNRRDGGTKDYLVGFCGGKANGSTLKSSLPRQRTVSSRLAKTR